MKIKIPDRLSECTLGQLVAFSDFATVSIAEERTDEMSDTMYEAVRLLCGLSISQFNMLTGETLKKVYDAIYLSFAKISKEVAEFSKAKNMAQTFEAVPELSHLIEAEHIGATRLKKWHLKRKYRPVTYEVVGNPESLPGHIWVKALDGLVGRIKQVKREEYWKEWNFAPIILSYVAWNAKESVLIKNDNNQMVVDWARINRMQEVFLQVPAKVGLSAFGFFLATMQIIWSVDNLSRSEGK